MACPKEWLDYAGEYRVPIAGGRYAATVFLKNGYLYIRYNVLRAGLPLKLTAYKPGVFVTSAGEPVRFEASSMTFRDIRSFKV